MECDVRISDLKRLARKLGILDKVVFHSGKLPDVRVGLRALDVMVIPSVASEAISRIALEGLALGVPIIASRWNALTETIGDAGFLVPPGDSERLALSLSRVLSSPHARGKVALRGPERVQRYFNPIDQVTALEALYLKLL